MFKQLKRVIAIFLILAFQGDFVAHFIGAQKNAWVQWALMYRAFAATSRYVDINLGANCTGNYSIASRNCSGSDGDAYTAANINSALAAMVGGDTTYIRGGTYTTPISDASFTWGAASSGAKIVIQGYPGDAKPLISVSGTAAINQGKTGDLYVTFQDFDVSCTGAYAECIGLQGGFTEFRNIIGNGNNSATSISGNVMLINAAAHDVLITGVHFHSPGLDTLGGFSSPYGYAIYNTGDRITIEYSLFDDARAYAIHSNCSGCDPDDVIVRYNVVTDVCTLLNTCAGILLGNGNRNKAYGNVVHHVGGAGGNVFGIATGNLCADCEILNNTINNTGVASIGWSNATARLIVKNNILTGSTNDFQNGSTNTRAFPTDGLADITDNRCDIAGTGCSTTSSPGFADIGNDDYRLCYDVSLPHSSCPGASAMIDIGIDVGLTTDIAGTTIPQGPGFDLGAYEANAIAPPTCPAQALVAQYSFNGVATDSSGNGNNGSLGTGVTYTTGKYGQAASFPGTSAGKISVPTADSLWICDGYTVEAWVQPTTTSTEFQGFVSKRASAGTGEGFFTYLSATVGYCANNGPLIGYKQTSPVYYCFGTGLVQDVWTHFAATYNGSSLIIYINGVFVTSGSATALLDQNNGDLLIGGSVFDEFFTGLIDELWIYNYARSEAQINTDMNTPIGALSAAISRKVNSGITRKYNSGIIAKHGLVQ